MPEFRISIYSPADGDVQIHDLNDSRDKRIAAMALLMDAAEKGAWFRVERVDPNHQLSGQDLLAVTLTVASWRRIRDHLFMDADAEDTGPAEVALYHRRRSLPTDEQVTQAQAEDSRLPCHSCASATHATADRIAALLELYGYEN
jgi:hypothetical protein